LKISSLINYLSLKIVCIKIDNFLLLYYIENWRDAQRAITIKYKEEGTFNLIMQNVKEGSIFLDIGANIGLYSILAGKKIGKTGKVISIEPHSINFSSLLKNININNLSDRIIPINIALTNSECFLPFNYYKLDSASTGSQLDKNGYDDFLFKEIITELKYATSIDCLIKDGLIPMPNIIKLDVDGLEYQILQGMKILLSSNQKPKIIQVEVNLSDRDLIYKLMEECQYSLVDKNYTRRCKQLILNGADPESLPYNAVFM
jgi:FkbM family methyltransferase